MNPFMLDQAAMYTAYHRDPRNVATHVLGVPAIVFAIIMALQRVPLDMVLPGLTLAWVVFILAAVFYLWMHTLAGFVLDVLLLAATWGSGALAMPPVGGYWVIAAVLFVGGWILQLAGHGFEGRRPAFADNLLQILVAPLFLVFEGLFALGIARDVKDAIAARSVGYGLGGRPASSSGHA
ncbi:MAG TPA: Mpo1-like protein [Hyphomicrobiales bacterium]|nr:Mpo1-like protein [Hyphomicrobiales bacterium]